MSASSVVASRSPPGTRSASGCLPVAVHATLPQAPRAEAKREARRPATGFDRWRDTDEARLTAWREQLVRLEAELAALVD